MSMKMGDIGWPRHRRFGELDVELEVIRLTLPISGTSAVRQPEWGSGSPDSAGACSCTGAAGRIETEVEIRPARICNRRIHLISGISKSRPTAVSLRRGRRRLDLSRIARSKSRTPSASFATEVASGKVTILTRSDFGLSSTDSRRAEVPRSKSRLSGSAAGALPQHRPATRDRNLQRRCGIPAICAS